MHRCGPLRRPSTEVDLCLRIQCAALADAAAGAGNASEFAVRNPFHQMSLKCCSGVHRKSNCYFHLFSEYSHLCTRWVRCIEPDVIMQFFQVEPVPSSIFASAMIVRLHLADLIRDCLAGLDANEAASSAAVSSSMYCRAR